jgi:hypothetical protein
MAAKWVKLALLGLVTVMVMVLLGWALWARFASTATIGYQFEYKNTEHTVILTIPLSEYRVYRLKPRPEGFDDYARVVSNPRDSYGYFRRYTSMATDPGDDVIIASLVHQLREMTADLDERDRVELTLRFVQSLTYAEDVVAITDSEYPRYTVETLFDQGGDCEDTSILEAAILTEMGYDVALLLFEEIDHMGLGIHFPESLEIEMYGNSWIYDDDGDGVGEDNERRYWYLDTSGSSSVGWCPEPYNTTPAHVYPVGE